MFLNILLKGWLIGFTIAMPVGPIGMLCIRNSLVRGLSYGLVTGIGAALADTFYGALAAFGLTWVHTFLDEYQNWIQSIGVIFLWYLGLSTFFAKNTDPSTNESKHGYARILFTTFFLTLTNPLTVFCFACVFNALGIQHTNEGFFHPLTLTTGIFLGASTWWLILSGGFSLFASKVTSRSSLLLNKISGGVIICFAFFATLLHINIFLGIL